jgi:hypothetical protein
MTAETLYKARSRCKEQDGAMRPRGSRSMSLTASTLCQLVPSVSHYCSLGMRACVMDKIRYDGLARDTMFSDITSHGDVREKTRRPTVT